MTGPWRQWRGLPRCPYHVVPPLASLQIECQEDKTTTIQERLGWKTTPELHDKIRRLWIKHSIAEDRRDLDGLIATLAEGCVYELMKTGERWEGHDAARSFYTGFLGVFPDAHFDLTDIVIGPQGVFEVATLTGHHQGRWAGSRWADVPPTGRAITMQVLIFFPWNPAAELFDGEKIWTDLPDLTSSAV
jgi:predicted ester cyclase